MNGQYILMIVSGHDVVTGVFLITKYKLFWFKFYD